MDRLYRINKKCPVCEEEHQYWTIKLTNEEQALLDKYTEKYKNESSLMSLLSYPGIDIIRTLKCGICHAEFEAHISVRKENEIGYNSSDSVQIGRIPF